MNTYVFPEPAGGHMTEGLTKRELFAAMMMQAMLSSSIPIKSQDECAALPEAAVTMADLLIINLERIKSP